MAGLSKKDLRAVLKSLEAQGCTLRPVSNGTWVGFPNGKSTTFHRSESDHRSVLNQRARVKAAGLTWPFDNEDNSKKEPDMARTPDKNIEKNVREAIELLAAETGANVFSTERVAELAGENAPATRRAMIRLGYRSLGHKKGWAHESTIEVQAEQGDGGFFMEKHVAPPESAATAAPAKLLKSEAPITIERVEPPVVTAKPTPQESRQVIVLNLSQIDESMTLKSLQAIYRAAGLRMDIVLRRIDN